MKVLMLGWEFPPYISGGLGIACRDLTRGLEKQGIEITFVLPHCSGEIKKGNLRVIGTNSLKLKYFRSLLSPYMTSKEYDKALRSNPSSLYGINLYAEVERFAAAISYIAKDESFDVIHAHDWMTYPAGIKAKKASGKPLVVHIHNTAFDRTGGNPNQLEYEIEKKGFSAADRIISVSNMVKERLVRDYGVNAEKIKVAYWGIDKAYSRFKENNLNEKIVLFVGRVTLQKGPDYFVEAAAKVLQLEPCTRFVFVGNGDMLPRMIDRTIELGINENFTFTGALSYEDVQKAFAMADLYVMPSVSEPFGLVALEAVNNGTPVLLSKQSGVSEAIRHCLLVDFWDIGEMANKIVSALRHNELVKELKDKSAIELLALTLDGPARKTMAVYNEVTAR